MDINSFIDACKARGMNVTYQRMAIFKSLMATKNHPTAEDIYREVLKEHPTLSRATVHKTLETLAEQHLISKVTQLHDRARFDGNTHPHHHLVCIHCKKIIDIESESLEGLSVPANLGNGFEVINYRVQFDGICSECSAGR